MIDGRRGENGRGEGKGRIEEEGWEKKERRSGRGNIRKSII